MAEKVMLFPTLSEKLLSHIRFQKTRYSFFYNDKDDNEIRLFDEQVDTFSSNYFIKDESGKWDQDRNNFGFRRRCSFRNFQVLFGPGGVSCRDSVLGLAVIWASSDSKQRGVIPICKFASVDKTVDTEVSHVFGKAQLRGEVTLSTVLYIAEAGNPSEDEMHLANTVGFLLGELDNCKIRLDGKGSIFPVFEVHEPGQPLWYVKCDWIEPTTDIFSEVVSINLNTAHKNYKYIDRKQQSTYNSQLLVEIMSAAISIIIEKLRQSPYWDQIIENDSLVEGSVGQAVYYFQSTLGWDMAAPESVSLSARKFFDKRM